MTVAEPCPPLALTPLHTLGTTNTCTNCNFFEPPDPSVTDGLGRCHWDAPTPAQARGVWPHTAPTDWCGQWAAIT